MYRTVFWTLWEKVRVRWSQRVALKHVYYHMWNSSPVQVRCIRQGAQGWCTGMTQRDEIRREVGGGSGWETHVNPWLIHVNVWQKPLQYCKVCSLQLKKKSRDITLPAKVHPIKALVFPVVTYRCKSWTIKKAEHQRILAVVLEKTFESPLDCKEIKPVNPKGNKSWIFTGRTDTEAEDPIP